MSPVKIAFHIVSRFRIFVGGLIKDSKQLQDRYPQYQIGRGCYGPLEIDTFGDHACVKIGAFCSFARGVMLMLGGEHHSGWVTTYPFDRKYFNCDRAPHSTYARGDIVIGNDVWIGNGALILSGSVIGDGAIIGARSVVRGVIPPYAVAVGSPARVVKYRFPPETIERLVAMAWWDWPDEKIRSVLPILMAEASASNLAKLEQGEL